MQFQLLSRVFDGFIEFVFLSTMKDQVSRQVQTEMRKNGQQEASSFTRPEKRPERRRKDTDRTSEALPQRAPDSKKLTQTRHERNQAELPMRLGVNSRESGHLPDTRPNLREPWKGRAPTVKVVSQSPVGSAATLKEKRVSKKRTQSASE